MRTPIADFVKEYAEKDISRFHMPGHKGQLFLGCEGYDITEIAGADALYEADGIIAESEAYAAWLFGTKKTVYSTEGSSQCIRAMLYLAINHWKQKLKEGLQGNGFCGLYQARPYVIAGRNVHKAFLYAAALLDFEIVWLWPDEMHSLCSCQISATQLEEELEKHEIPPAAVYLTCPDYLGGMVDIKAMAEVCHKNGTVLAVDNAHGAYLHFLKEKQHPMDLGADICCDSAHKTLPVLTGGAYLQISQCAPKTFGEQAKQAMALFGSTSPSYLIMSSLDLCNQYLENDYQERLEKTIDEIDRFKGVLKANGWQVEETDPLKITVRAPKGSSGVLLAEQLRKHRVECEYADAEYLVLMATPENHKEDFDRVIQALGINELPYVEKPMMQPVRCEQMCSVKEALFADRITIAAKDSVGRICGAPTVGCPPAIPVVISGEQIDENAVAMFAYYGIEQVDVMN